MTKNKEESYIYRTSTADFLKSKPTTSRWVTDAKCYFFTGKYGHPTPSLADYLVNNLSSTLIMCRVLPRRQDILKMLQQASESDNLLDMACIKHSLPNAISMVTLPTTGSWSCLVNRPTLATT